ncbi:MAG: efflux RND transporter periplasmic adaptor subunit [Acidobacteria bacterium]|nr:efflux RND transporter periplasmic adaptor subunit [Acidobacteriota bacterium]
MMRLWMLVPLVLLAGCGGGAVERESQAPAPVRIAAESVATVQQGTIRTGPLISGELTAEREATVRAQVGGSIVEAAADEGEHVRKGALLARIEARDLQAAAVSARVAVDGAEHTLEVAQRQAARTAALVEAGALARQDLETARSGVAAAQSELASARAQLASARQSLADTKVTSPIAGVVSRRSVSVGDVVSPGAALYTVIDPSSMRLSAFVPSERIGQLHVGDPVEFAVSGYQDRSFVGRVQRINPAADPTTRQVPIIVTIPNADGRLIAGLYAQGRVNTESQTGLVVPLAAVDRSGPSPFVTRVGGGRTERVGVTLGLEDPETERVVVGGGLQPGDLVLLGAARTVMPDTPVTIVPPAPAGSAAR